QPLAPLDVILCTSPFSHRLLIEVQLTSDLGKIQAALLMQEPDLRVKLVGDHGCSRPSRFQHLPQNRAQGQCLARALGWWLTAGQYRRQTQYLVKRSLVSD